MSTQKFKIFSKSCLFTLFALLKFLLFCSLTTFCVISAQNTTPIDIDQSTIVRAPGKCLLARQCGSNPGKVSDFPMPCFANNTNAFIIEEDDIFELLKRTCPDIVKDKTREEVRTCCSKPDIQRIADGFDIASAIFSRCPSCWYNFRQMACQANCNPDQSLFVYPEVFLPAQPGADDMNDISVPTYGMYLEEKLAFSWFDSCKDVFYPAISDTILAVTCQPPQGEDCNAYYWFKFLNTNALSPIDVPQYFITQPGEIPQLETTQSYEDFRSNGPIGQEKMMPLGMNSELPSQPGQNYTFESSPTQVTCYQPVPYQDKNETCSCIDCPPNPLCNSELDKEPAKSNIAFTIITPVLWIILVGSFAFTQYYYVYKYPEKRRQPDDIDDDKKETVFEDLYLRMYNRVGKSFEWWAINVVCKFPKSTLLVVTICILVLVGGFPQTEFTTDPVELWVDPASQNYDELMFFNNKFDPFYRSELVIARLKSEYEGPGFSKFLCQGYPVEFSEIFRDEYMEEFFTLQDSIFTMSNIDPKEICFRPLYPDSNNCATQSIYQYWQNDLNTFKKVYNRSDLAGCAEDTMFGDKTIQWHDHFLACTVNPSSVDDLVTKSKCLGDYGGPAFPYVALGGYPIDENNKRTYSKSTALIMSLQFDNYVDRTDPDYEKAMKWEQDFINFMANYESKYFDIAYYAERSIEDEIDRAGQADIPLFIGAYVTIFIYLSVALGTYTAAKWFLFEVRITLGLVGLMVVASSAFAALGLFGYLKVKSNLIVAEVVPFLLLSIGADNIFIFVLLEVAKQIFEF